MGAEAEQQLHTFSGGWGQERGTSRKSPHRRCPESGLTLILSLSSDLKFAFWAIIQGDIISYLYRWLGS